MHNLESLTENKAHKIHQNSKMHKMASSFFIFSFRY